MTETRKTLLLRGVLGLVLAAHLTIGFGLMFAGDAGLRLVADFYGVDDLAVTPQFAYIVKPLGAYMVMFGVLAFLPILNPSRYRGVILCIAGLLVLRVVQRVLFAGEIQEAFGLTTGALIGQSVFFLVIAGALVVLRPARG